MYFIRTIFRLFRKILACSLCHRQIVQATGPYCPSFLSGCGILGLLRLQISRLLLPKLKLWVSWHLKCVDNILNRTLPGLSHQQLTNNMTLQCWFFSSCHWKIKTFYDLHVFGLWLLLEGFSADLLIPAMTSHCFFVFLCPSKTSRLAIQFVLWSLSACHPGCQIQPWKKIQNTLFCLLYIEKITIYL